MTDNTMIKADPDAPGASPVAFEEEDIYEDAGDMEFNTDPAFQTIYLAKVPPYLWEAWSKMGDDEEIRIGTIRQHTASGPNGTQKIALGMLLDNQLSYHQGVPKEYELGITSEAVRNTFAFTEKDLPGFKSKSRAKFDPASANMPSRLTRPKNKEPMAKQPYDPNRRFQPYFRKAIPKRTMLAGRIRHEVNCIAVENDESVRILTQRTLDAMKPKVQTKFVPGDLLGINGDYINPGTMAASNVFTGFIKTKPGSSSRPQMQKTARMPENDLLDLIFKCFQKYQYWSMKAFRAELKQPEAYLRETLEKVATLAKSGRFATQWSLKAQNQLANYDEAAALEAPTAENAEDSDADEEDDDEEDVKFEDV